MWCSHCKSETPATGSLSSEGSACAKCGRRLAGGRSSENTIRQARDIIARWSSSDLLDQISALPPIPPMPRPHFSASATAETRPAEPEQSVHETEPDNSAAELPKTVPASVLNETTQEPTTEIEEDGTLESVSEVIEDLSDDSVMEDDDADDVVAIEVTEEDLLAEESPQSESISEITIEDTLAEPEIEIDAELEVLAELEPQPDPTTEQSVDVETVAEKPEPTAKPTPDQTTNETELTLLPPTYVPLPVALAARAARKEKDAEQRAAESASKPTEESKPTADSTVKSTTMSEESPADSSQKIIPAKTDTKTEAAKPDAKSQPDTPISRPRANQRRAAQPRPTRERKHPAQAEQKGSKPVSRKFRVDTPGGESQEAPEEAKANVAGARIQSNSPKGGRRHRVDSGTPLDETLSTGDSRVRTQNRPRRRYIDDAHEDAIRGPHFQVTAPKRSNLTSMTGHVLAYLGVLGLTVGTAIVICGHFLGYSDYTPTGWLVTTVAQMMLFLGVINLVSGGIDQTNVDVSNRINTLGEQLLRIEQVTEEALRGPKISARRYMGEEAEVEDRERETVGRQQ